MDATAAAQLDEEIQKPVDFAFLDFVNEPIRANNSGGDVVVTGTGEPDLDGFTFFGLAADLAEISEIKKTEGGTETVTATLSGLLDLDNDMLNEIGDEANYQGREARFWKMLRNQDNVQQGTIYEHYTGYMIDIKLNASPEKQVIVLTIEGWRAAHSKPSGRTYLDQSSYDSGDLSARASIAIANGTSGNPITNNTGGGGGSAASIPLPDRFAVNLQ